MGLRLAWATECDCQKKRERTRGVAGSLEIRHTHFVYLVLNVFETEPDTIIAVGIKLAANLLPQLPECWDHPG